MSIFRGVWRFLSEKQAIVKWPAGVDYLFSRGDRGANKQRFWCVCKAGF